MREQIGKRLRFEIFKRDGFVCQYCGAHPPQAVLHVDHINPVALGGGNESDNLITSCSDCNLGKSARPLSSVPKSLEERAAETAEREAQIAGYAAVMEAALERIEADAWRVAEVLSPGAEAGYPTNKLTSIKTFVKRLGVHDTLDAAGIAVSRKPFSKEQSFRYFCAICWNWIRDGREAWEE